MIQRVYEGARQSKLLSDLIVACDDERILKAVQGFGGKACMTSAHHPSGTDRVAEAVLRLDCEWVVNIQGDEPLMKGQMIDQVIRGLESDAPMSTLARPMHGIHGWLDPNVVKVVCDDQGYALYFSRAHIPYARDLGPDFSDSKKEKEVFWLKHVGLYAYRKDFLIELTKRKPSSLELIERLEQLRVLQTGSRIKVMLIEEDSIGVDTPKDLEEVKKHL